MDYWVQWRNTLVSGGPAFGALLLFSRMASELETMGSWQKMAYWEMK